MQGDGGAGVDYAEMFNGFFRKPEMASTYKPVFLAGLVDIAAARKEGGPLDAGGWVSSGGGRVRIDLNLTAVPFAKFYWDMLAGFGPRHTPVRMADARNRSRDVNIVRVINEEIARRKSEEVRRRAAGGGVRSAAAGRAARGRGKGAPAGGEPPALEELASDEMAGFRERVVKRSIKPEVVKHLASNASEPRRGGARAASRRQASDDRLGLYEYRGAENCIVLGEEAVAYMKRNEFTLKAALGELIDRHLEKNNPAARHIATMVNLNKELKAKSNEVDKIACKAMPSQDDIDPLLSISLDLAAGLAGLSRTRA